MAESESGFHASTSGGGTVPLIPPVREGLPPSYRMRADAHYVDQLSTRSAGAPVRLIEVGAIERRDGPAPAAAFVESIRRHGVLQPLLVTGPAGRYRVIAGHTRLAAAVAAGLREVPCLLQSVDEEQAGTLAEAANLRAIEPAAHPADTAGSPAAEAALRDIADALAALSSSVHLLGHGALAGAVATDLVRAESTRAMHLLLAYRLLRDDVPVTRARVGLRRLAEGAALTAAPECRLRTVAVRIELDDHRGDITGDEALLGHALTGLVMATAAIMPAERTMTITAPVPSPSDATIRLDVSQRAVTLPDTWLARTFARPWPAGGGASGALVLLQATQRVAALHGGQVHAAAAGAGTTLSLALPARSVARDAG
jgi:hypothetical protein